MLEKIILKNWCASTVTKAVCNYQFQSGLGYIVTMFNQYES